MKRIDWMKVLPYVVAMILFVGFALAYCSPLLEGKVLNAGDVTNYVGASQEVRDFRESHGRQIWWTNAMFGGMPTFQVSANLPSAAVRHALEKVQRLGMTVDFGPAGLLLAYLSGFFLMLICFGINPWLSIVGAFALTLSSYFMLIIPAGHMTKAAAIGCLAPMVGGFYAIFRKRYWLGVPLILIYGIIGFTQHPQMTYYVVLLLGVLFLAELYLHISEKRWKDLGISTLVLAVAMLLMFGTKWSWWQMNNAYLAQTMRGGHSELNQSEKTEKEQAGLDIDYATAWSYGKAETLTLLIPNYMGGASGYEVGDKSLLYEQMVDMRIPKQSARQFCQHVPTYWGEKAFTSGPIYVGAVICFLFILALIIVPGAYKWALLAATIFSLLLAWGRNFMPLTQLFYDYFPMYNKFRAVESILIVAEITIPLLAMLGLKKVVETADKQALLRPICIAGGITSGICLMVALFGGMIDCTSSYDTAWKGQVGDQIYRLIVDQRSAMMKADAWRSLIFSLAAMVVVGLFAKDKLRWGWMIAVLGVLVLADMVPVDRRFFGSKDFVSKKDDERIFRMQPYEEQILQDKSLDYRVLNVAANTFNDARTSYRLKSIGGYSAVKLRRYQDLIDAHISKNNWKVIDMLNTKYLITRDGVRQNPGAMGNAWFVDNVRLVDTPDEESQALWTMDLRHEAVADRQFAEALDVTQPQAAPLMAYDEEKIVLTDYQPDLLTYQSMSERNRVAVFSEIYYPTDWHIYIDGEETQLARVNYTLRAAVIPAGSHTIVMAFVPKALAMDKWCLALMIIILLTSAVLLSMPLWCKQIKAAEQC